MTVDQTLVTLVEEFVVLIHFVYALQVQEEIRRLRLENETLTRNSSRLNVRKIEEDKKIQSLSSQVGTCLDFCNWSVSFNLHLGNMSDWCSLPQYLLCSFLVSKRSLSTLIHQLFRNCIIIHNIGKCLSGMLVQLVVFIGISKIKEHGTNQRHWSNSQLTGTGFAIEAKPREALNLLLPWGWWKCRKKSSTVIMSHELCFGLWLVPCLKGFVVSCLSRKFNTTNYDLLVTGSKVANSTGTCWSTNSFASQWCKVFIQTFIDQFQHIVLCWRGEHFLHV